MSSLSERIAQLPPEKRRLLLNKLRQSKGEEADGRILPVSRTSNAIPLSFAQERLWFLDQLDPGGFAYNLPQAIRVSGRLDVEALRLAIEATVRRHEILRTRFLTSDGRPVQVIDPELRVEMPLSDLSAQPETVDEEVKRWAVVEAEKPFDLTRGPLLRTRLLKLAEQEHLWLLTMHHIITDAWSLGLFFHDMSVAYEAFEQGRFPVLGDQEVQYADFAIWERQQAQSEAYESRLSFWLDRLSDIPSLLELPLDHPRPAVQTSRGAVEFFKLAPALSDEIRALTRTEGATLFMTLLAAFKVLLYRYTGQTDMVVGTPIANRYRPELEKLIGFFVNNVVLRTDLSGRPTFRELLRRVKQVTLDSFERSEVPFGKLVEAIQPSRDLSSSPLFHVMFVLQNAPMEAMQLAGLKLSPEVRGNYRISRFDLTLYMGDEDERIGGAFEYNLDLFEPETVSRMIGHLQVLLENVASNPDLPIDDFPLLTDRERQLLLSMNATDKRYSRDFCYYQLFEERARQRPDALAVEVSDKRVTYSQLNTLGDRVAARLQKAGVGPNMPVGLCVERSVEMLAGMLGIHKAGGAYVPLDPSYPGQRLSYMLEDSGASVLLTQESLRATLPDFHGTVLTLDFLKDEPARGEDSFRAVPTHPEALAYIIYTSGTTGKPKGVAIPHRALVNFLMSMQERPGIDPNDTLLAVTTLSFDIAGLELFLPLIAGATVAIAGREETSDGRHLSDLLHQTGATIMQATPATWRLLLDSGWSNGDKLKMLCGGEALPRALASRLLSTGGELWNMYGPTESTIWSSVGLVEAGTGPVYIGRPIANTRIHILDNHLAPVPAGVHGELYIGGDGLADGYFGRPELTAGRFVPSPFQQGPGMRLYRTGDLARYTASGDLEILGRIDHQVKVRGFRIELGEIENVLTQAPEVNSAVAVVLDDDKLGKRLVAYVVAAEESEPSPENLRLFLKEALPDYMVPGTFVFLAAFPLTPSGKVDRNALPAPDSGRPELQTGYVAPQNETERKIAEIWRTVLGIDEIGIDDNFFDLGGHSLLLVQVQGHLSRAFGRDVSILDLFKHSSPKALATFLTGAGEQTGDFNKLADLASRQKRAQAQHETLMKGVKGNADE